MRGHLDPVSSWLLVGLILGGGFIAGLALAACMAAKDADRRATDARIAARAARLKADEAHRLHTEQLTARHQHPARHLRCVPTDAR